MEIKLRDAVENDAHLLLKWRNDPDTAANSINQKAVTWEEHSAWLTSSLDNPDRYIMISEFEPDRPCGMIRFDRLGGDDEPVRGFEVSISIDPYLRCRGMGRAVLKAGIDLFNRDRLFATIRGENIASLIIFLASGFILTEYDSKTGLAYLKREPK